MITKSTIFPRPPIPRAPSPLTAQVWLLLTLPHGSPADSGDGRGGGGRTVVMPARPRLAQVGNNSKGEAHKNLEISQSYLSGIGFNSMIRLLC